MKISDCFFAFILFRIAHSENHALRSLAMLVIRFGKITQCFSRTFYCCIVFFKTALNKCDLEKTISCALPVTAPLAYRKTFMLIVERLCKIAETKKDHTEVVQHCGYSIFIFNSSK